MHTRFFALLLPALFALTPMPGAADGPRGSLRAPLEVPVNLPLTGPFATYGAAVERGASFAIEDAERAGTTVPLRFDWQDNEGKPARTVSVLREQLRRNPPLYISGVRPQTMAIWDEIAKLKIPHFLWIFDRSIENGGAPDFRTWVNFKVEPPLFLSYTRAKAMKRIAVVYVRLPNTEDEYQNAVLPGLREQGATVMVEAYELNKDDFRDIGAKVRQFKPDGIIVCGFQNHLVSIIKSFRTLRLITDGNTLVSYDMLDAAPLLGAEDVEGIRFTSPAFLLSGEESAYGAWRKRFAERFHQEPLYTHVYAYDMTTMLIDAVRRSSDTSPEALTAALRQTDLPGISGRLHFDPDGNLDVSVVLGVYRGGKPVLDVTAEGTR